MYFYCCLPMRMTAARCALLLYVYKQHSYCTRRCSVCTFLLVIVQPRNAFFVEIEPILSRACCCLEVYLHCVPVHERTCTSAAQHAPLLYKYEYHSRWLRSCFVCVYCNYHCLFWKDFEPILSQVCCCCSMCTHVCMRERLLHDCRFCAVIVPEAAPQTCTRHQSLMRPHNRKPLN